MERAGTNYELSRRTLIKSAGATLIVAAVTPAGLILGFDQAWSAAPEALKPETFATLVQMSRDIYPHDRLEDSYYAAAVSVLDSGAKADAALKTTLEDGVSGLDTSAIGGKSIGYRGLPDEKTRIALLKDIETGPFFQAVRGNLITGIYNNKEVWPIFGYEGESASKGGYIDRGFNDLDWLKEG
jgi:hypothetical protein